MRRPFIAVLALFFLASCSKNRTEVVLGLATDLTAPDQLDHVQLMVQRDGVIIIQQDWDVFGQPRVPYELPGSYGLYTDDGSQPRVQVDFIGFHSSKEILRRTAIFTPITGQTLFMRIPLVKRCEGVTCPADQTCVEGACASAEVNSGTFPAYLNQQETTVDCNSGDKLIDTGTRQPLPVNGSGSCAANQVCGDSTCYNVVGQDGGVPDLSIPRDLSMPDLTTPPDLALATPSFTYGASYGNSVGPGLALADFNGDGKLDVVTANSTGLPGVSIFFGNGDGTLQPPMMVPWQPMQPSSVVAADFNKDGKPDIAVADRGAGTDLIGINPGNGMFGVMNTAVQTQTTPIEVQAGDYDNDGTIDLINLGNDVSQLLSVIPGDGMGGFGTYKVLGTNGGASFVLGDFNKDGKLDVVVDASFKTIETYLGNGDGTFQTPPKTFAFGNGMSAFLIATGDVDGDGNLDIVGDDMSSTFYVLHGVGDGTFTLAGNHPSAGAGGLALADVNLDGRLDVLMTDGMGKLDVYTNQGGGVFNAPAVTLDLKITNPGGALVTGDLNGDNKPDVVAWGSDSLLHVAINTTP